MSRVPGSPRGSRSPEAKKRRAPKRNAVIRASGRRVACDECKSLHKPPECPPGAEPATLTLRLPHWLHRELNAHVVAGERSAWVTRLIRRELQV